MPRVLPQHLMRINVLKGSTVCMSKHNLIIYSLLLAAAPISVLADSSTTSAATVGMFSPPTAPSVGHRPGTPRDGYELKFNGLDFSIEKYTPFRE